jgi:hypothetical protein
MRIGRKIYDKAGWLIFGIAVWLILFSILIKAYNAFIYPVNYHGSWSNVWSAPLFSMKYFKDYWSNSTNIIIYTFFLLPPLLASFVLAYGFRVAKQENKIKFQKMSDDFIQNLNSKKKNKRKKKI